MEVTTPPSLFSNFSMESHTQWNSIPVSPIEMDDSKNLDSPISAPFLPLKKSGSMRNQQLLELPPSIVTGSSHKNTFSDLSFHENTNNMYKQDIEMHVENVIVEPRVHCRFTVNSHLLKLTCTLVGCIRKRAIINRFGFLIMYHPCP